MKYDTLQNHISKSPPLTKFHLQTNSDKSDISIEHFLVVTSQTKKNSENSIKYIHRIYKLKKFENFEKYFEKYFFLVSKKGIKKLHIYFCERTVNHRW